MDWYNAEGEKLGHAVQVEIDGVECWKMNPGADVEWREANGYIYDHNPVPPPPAPEPEPEHVFTKLKIRRAMRTLGIEGKLNTLLAASETFANDWADAQEIDLADPVLVSALALGSVTQEEIEAIRRVIMNGGELDDESVIEAPADDEQDDSVEDEVVEEPVEDPPPPQEPLVYQEDIDAQEAQGE